MIDSWAIVESDSTKSSWLAEFQMQLQFQIPC